MLLCNNIDNTSILYNLSAGTFPIPLLTELGSSDLISTVMAAFRDHEGNTAVSGGVANYSGGCGFLSVCCLLSLPFHHGLTQEKPPEDTD